MRPDSTARRLLLAMLTTALVVPIAICVVAGLGRLLGAMGDAPAAVATLDWVAGALGIFWVLDLICLVLLLAIESLREPREPDEPQ